MPDTAILLIAFGPFRARPVNGSATVARALHDQRIAGCRLISAVLPVCWGEPERRLPQLLTEHRPELLLGLGEGQPGAMRFETRAYNRSAGEDTTGQLPVSNRLDRQGPTQCPSRLDFDPGWFDQTRLGFIRSDDAGEYLCNSLLYTGLRLMSGPCGFVHLPPQLTTPDRNYLATGIVDHLQVLIERNR